MTVRLDNLTKRFGDKLVVDRVSIDLVPGRLTALIGPNGGGKSTLLNLIAGLIQPTSGQVLIDGREDWAPGTVGLLASNPGLLPLLTGAENLDYFGGLHQLTPKQVTDATAPTLERLGLTKDQLQAPTSTYSSGMAQKLSLARALTMKPKVLLLDEPSSNLDPPSALALMRAMRERAEAGLVVVLCTHDLHTVERLADRVLVLSQSLRHDAQNQPDGTSLPSTLLQHWPT